MMHKIDIPADILARSRRARGRDRILETIDPARVAHLIVDLQNGFMAEGALVEVPGAREMVPNVNIISAAIRSAGGVNVFLRYTYDESEPQPWITWYRTYMASDVSAAFKNAFSRGAEPWQLWPSLEVQDSDLIVDKTRFSAFVPGTCRLDEILRTRGIETVIITGTVTNVCCESTARDAMQRNYNVIFVADGTAALTDAEHNATLSNMTMLFADVVTTSEASALIEADKISCAAA
jgi:ureidoacrylate peracid hydrolase